MFHDQYKDIEFFCTENAEEGLDSINYTVKAILIISEKLGMDMIP